MHTPKHHWPLIFIFATLWSANLKSQTIWADDFADSNFTQNPVWSGDSTHFIVNAQKKLQLSAPAAAATSILSTPSKAALNGSWEFYVNLNFNPSSSNFAEVYFMADAPNPAQTQSGYFLRLGGGTADRISLFKKSGTSTQLLAESADGVLNTNTVNLRVKVLRDANSNFIVLADTTGGTNYVTYATATDSTHNTSSFLVLKCVYTATRSTQFYFDDFSVNGSIFTDQIPPKITSFAFAETNKINLFFSENVETASATSTANYTLTNLQQKPSLVLHPSPNQVQLHFTQPFKDGQIIQLQVRDVEDLAGNALADTIITATFENPGFKSIIFTEIMADPAPTVGLPDAEYVEIYNISKTPINLQDWRFVADKDSFLLPNYILAPQSYALILRFADTAFFKNTNKIGLALPSGWLLNGGEKLTLYNKNKVQTDAVLYATSWYRNAAKVNGGWSLELIDLTLNCTDAGNWSASNATLGGTPGLANQPEFAAQVSAPQISGLFFIDDFNVEIEFSQAISQSFLPTISSNQTLSDQKISANFANRLALTFSAPIGTNCSIIIAQTQACTGFYTADTLVFSLPTKPALGDVVLNEILFNPYSGGVDFIELWNISTHTFLANDLKILALDEANLPKETFAIGTANRMMLPKNYWAITTSYAGVAQFYSTGKLRHFSVLDAMPSLPDDAGAVALALADLSFLEYVRYTKNWHHTLIKTQDGVSLERINPNLPSQNQQSWHSAATAVNYATPALQNSQFASQSAQADLVWLGRESFSPNNDGHNDVLVIAHNLAHGAMLTLRVFGISGKQEYTIANNELVQPNGTYAWSGISENGTTVATGIYIIFAEWFYPDGNRGMAKLNVAVSR